ncbi:DUF4917 family protein [bacterium]|nr:DUF4917 family protein [bacterium]
MSQKEITLLTYQVILEKIEGQKCHLLLGNGFNSSLKVKTDYESIFAKMMKEDAEYLELKSFLDANKYDLEKLIEELKGRISNEDKFLTTFIHNKVKLDFMKATSKLAASQVNTVYKKRNEGIHLLLKNFTNYFTLNYDPFLYLLLMKFKKGNKEKNEALVLPQTHLFQTQDIDDSENDLFSKIQEVRVSGKFELHSEKIDDCTDLNSCSMKAFTHIIKPYFKKQGYAPAKIDQAIALVWEREKENNTLEIDDAFRQDSLFDEEDIDSAPVFKSDIKTQNLFFLHGAFHLYEEKKITKKITQTSDKALYERLEKIISDEEKSIICVFSNSNKTDEILTNEYLKSAHKKLSELSGDLVIIGSSLDENDNHILEQINKSNVETLYISTTKRSRKRIFERAQKAFPKKKLNLFDAETITYKRTLPKK